MRLLPGRQLVLPWTLALAFVAIVGFAGSRDVFWTGDFCIEVYPRIRH